MENSGFTSRSIGTVSGVFFTKADADRAYNNLLRRGHTADDISILMSDETLNKHQDPDGNIVQTDPEAGPEDESALSRAANAFSGVIISITSMISLPGLGIAISNTLQKKMPKRETEETPYEKAHAMTGSGIPDQHAESYSDRMQEGGIIISVDPRNREEKRAIIEDFRQNNGHDILGDDGYTEFD
ncbi:general stress protein [Dyadobacter psychrotolerans]|uniref:Uncharacterized protein n=1 Tax=Dyadobacter psychrotolerans TaxID=2541721 RepID=A0A4R5DK15_9BACT|nr:general stress protein [Dyadobacter psychrotolerans]TDE14486.1 hypothetical protein E0F88_14905 [Dyadobacter psychrotolerans]